MSGRIFYHGTDNEVGLGDRVQFRTPFFRRKRLGTIVCIPVKTALEFADEGKAPEDWLLRFDDGTYTGWMYHPEELQPTKRLRLLERGSGHVEEISNDELDRLDNEESGGLSGQVGEFLGCVMIIVLLLIAFVVLIRIF